MASVSGLESARERLTTITTTASNFLTAFNKDYGRYVPSGASVNLYSDIFIRGIFIVKLIESVRYIYRRKRGTRGPSALVPLLQFWVCHSLLTTFSRIIFLPPFLRLLCTLPLLSNSGVASLYDLVARQLFHEAEPHAEAALRDLREKYVEFRQWGIKFMDDLVEIYRVGGMAAVIAAFREQPSANARAPSRLVAERDIKRDIPAFKPESFDDDGVEVLSKVRRSVVVSAKPEEPKPAYSDSRKLRESFRRRAAAARKESTSQQ